jgi:hypothetical protein
VRDTLRPEWDGVSACHQNRETIRNSRTDNCCSLEYTHGEGVSSCPSMSSIVPTVEEWRFSLRDTKAIPCVLIAALLFPRGSSRFPGSHDCPGGKPARPVVELRSAVQHLHALQATRAVATSKTLVCWEARLNAWPTPPALQCLIARHCGNITRDVGYDS